MIKNAICPYCGYENMIDVDDMCGEIRLMRCDSFGCRKYFVADVNVRIDITPRKIEGL